MSNVNFTSGPITVDGVPGLFSQTNQTGGFCHIHHCIANDDGIGCKSREFVGSVPRGSWDGARNNEFGRMVEQKVSSYIDRVAS